MGAYFNAVYQLLQIPITLFGFTFSFFEVLMFILVVSIVFMLISGLMK